MVAIFVFVVLLINALITYFLSLVYVFAPQQHAKTEYIQALLKTNAALSSRFVILSEAKNLRLFLSLHSPRQ
jgi:glucan phosphoethanolaminetransferase (alkaline phosphatase superfamily)